MELKERIALARKQAGLSQGTVGGKAGRLPTGGKQVGRRSFP